jgi:nucleoid-associated protein YgaU
MSEKKSFLDRAIDAISTRDEKAALEEAQKAAEEQEKQAEDSQKELEKTKAKMSAAEMRARQAEAKAKRLEAQLRKQRVQQMREAFEARRNLLQENQFVASHTVEKDDTLSGIALHYYGSAAEDYWRLIYEANKGVIGDNPNMILIGQTFKIPALPDELKK